MSELFHTLVENYALFHERRRATLQACELDHAAWIAQDREGDWCAYNARPMPGGLGWECEESAIFLFKGRPNGNWPESARMAPRRKKFTLLCHSPCSELPQRFVALFS